MINELTFKMFPQFIQLLVILCELMLPFIVFMHCSVVFVESICIDQELIVERDLWVWFIIFINFQINQVFL